jgi:hypothetical protein
LAASWLLSFLSTSLLVFFLHLCGSTRTYLAFAYTLLHIHDTPSIIYIFLLPRLTNLFSLSRLVFGWRCVALLGKSFADFVLLKRTHRDAVVFSQLPSQITFIPLIMINHLLSILLGISYRGRKSPPTEKKKPKR